MATAPEIWPIRTHPGFLRPSICFVFTFLLLAPFCGRTTVSAAEAQWVEVRSPKGLSQNNYTTSRGIKCMLSLEW
jgi:hypothetical protein